MNYIEGIVIVFISYLMVYEKINTVTGKHSHKTRHEVTFF
jgi:hypothetical protein